MFIKNNCPILYSTLTEALINCNIELLQLAINIAEADSITIESNTATSIEITCGKTYEPMNRYTEMLTEAMLEILNTNKKFAHTIRKNGCTAYFFDKGVIIIDYNNMD